MVADILILVGTRYSWAGWLARTSVPYPVTMLAGIPIGAAMVLCFQGWIGFLGDCYRLYSSSAVSSVAVSRTSLVFPYTDIETRRFASALILQIAATVIGRSLSGAT